MIVLGVESSCDETGAAVVTDSGKVLSDVVQSQVIHAEWGGVVPELASRDHARNVLPVAREALARAGVSLHAIDGVAVTCRPGLVARRLDAEDEHDQLFARVTLSSGLCAIV